MSAGEADLQSRLLTGTFWQYWVNKLNQLVPPTPSVKSVTYLTASAAVSTPSFPVLFHQLPQSTTYTLGLVTTAPPLYVIYDLSVVENGLALGLELVKVAGGLITWGLPAVKLFTVVGRGEDRPKSGGKTVAGDGVGGGWYRGPEAVVGLSDPTANACWPRN